MTVDSSLSIAGNYPPDSFHTSSHIEASKPNKSSTEALSSYDDLALVAPLFLFSSHVLYEVIQERGGQVVGRRARWLWDDWNTDHIAQHGVAPFEAEEVGDRPRYVERWRERYLAWGSTTEGRFLLVIYVRKPAGRYVISTRDMEEGERRRLRRLTGR